MVCQAKGELEASLAEQTVTTRLAIQLLLDAKPGMLRLPVDRQEKGLAHRRFDHPLASKKSPNQAHSLN